MPWPPVPLRVVAGFPGRPAECLVPHAVLASRLPGLLLALLAFPALAEPRAPLPRTIESPRIVVRKARRELELYSGRSILKVYRAGLGLRPVPPKERQGDRATPEGRYVVCRKNPRSQFTLSLGLSYPNEPDADRGLATGLVTKDQHRRIVEASRAGRCPPWDTPLGGEIFIHGSGSASDWTWGCVALDDDDVRELYPRIPVGTPVVIEP